MRHIVITCCICAMVLLLVNCNDGGSAEAGKNNDSSAMPPTSVDSVAMPTVIEEHKHVDSIAKQPETGDPLSERKHKPHPIKIGPDSVNTIRR